MTRVIISIVVTLVWAANYLAAIIEPSYHPPIEINGVMLLVAGYFFGSGIKKTIRNGKDDASGT